MSTRRLSYCGTVGSGYRIIATLAPGMAANEALHGQRQAPARAVSFDRLSTVCRAGRVKSARGRKQRADRQLVQPHSPQCHVFHHVPVPARVRCACRSIRCTVASTADKDCPTRAGLPTITRSYPGLSSPRCARTASRKRRRTRFLTHALPSRFPTENPTREPRPPFGAAVITRTACDHARPSLRTRAKS